MRTTRLAGIAATAALVGLPLTAGPPSAHGHDDHELTAELTQLNDSGASGTAWAKVEGNQVEIKLETEGHLAGAPRAQHIHIGGQNVCPTNDQTGNGPDGALQTSDAADQYGAVKVSLTNEPGKTGADAASTSTTSRTRPRTHTPAPSPSTRRWPSRSPMATVSSSTVSTTTGPGSTTGT